MTSDLDRLLERVDNVQRDGFQMFVIDRDELRALIERVKEAEKELKVSTTTLEKTEAQLKASEKASQDWRLDFGPAAQRRINILETRLRAAEEVVELARKSYTRQGYKVFRDALSHYDEAVKR